MASLLHALRGNAHALNYVLIATAALVPIIAYGQFRAPSSLDVEQRLVSCAVQWLQLRREQQWTLVRVHVPMTERASGVRLTVGDSLDAMEGWWTRALRADR